MGGALLGALLLSGVSASAEEKQSPVSTALDDTTISGGGDTTITIGERNHTLSASQIRALWRTFILWFIFHVRR
jgi:hypothetical protein